MTVAQADHETSNRLAETLAAEHIHVAGRIDAIEVVSVDDDAIRTVAHLALEA